MSLSERQMRTTAQILRMIVQIPREERIDVLATAAKIVVESDEDAIEEAARQGDATTPPKP